GTTAPVIVALDTGSGGEPALFPTGAELHRYVPAGQSTLRVYSPHDGPLAGSLELTATPVVQVVEGLGDPQTLAPGATALFGFELTRAGNVGVGVRSQPDRAAVRLLDAAGRSLGEGVAQLHRLEAGGYLGGSPRAARWGPGWRFAGPRACERTPPGAGGPPAGAPPPLSRKGRPHARSSTTRDCAMNRFAMLAALASVLATLAPRSDAEVAVQFDRLQRADNARVVPEKFLRSCDPVTIFFPRDLGPAGRGPEDTPER